MRFRLAAFLPTLLATVLAAPLAAQQVPLPHATGNLVPPAGWVVLRDAALTASERASDPTAEPGRRLLRDLLATLVKSGAAADHVVLHAPGDGAGSARIVDASSAATEATAGRLQRPETMAAMGEALLAALRKDQFDASYDGGEATSLCGVGGVRLRFTVQKDGRRWLLHHHAMPAHTRVQYFEALLLPEDTGGPAAVDALLRTFDGAVDAPPTLIGLLIGGVAGALAGMLAGLWRKNRLQRAAAAARD
ncbi:MAG: hypothetical protein ACK501_22020 [Planctomycetota bacterium]